MTDKKSRESRRKLLKSIAAGSGVIVAGKSLPESWSRPVVDAVMLPAHAQTSIANIYSSAIIALINPPGAICVNAQGGVADITLWFEFTADVDLSIFQASGVPIGPAALTSMTLVSQTCGFPDTCEVSCVSANGIASGQFDLNGNGLTGYSAAIAACIPDPPANCVVPITSNSIYRN